MDEKQILTYILDRLDDIGEKLAQSLTISNTVLREALDELEHLRTIQAAAIELVADVTDPTTSTLPTADHPLCKIIRGEPL